MNQVSIPQIITLRGGGCGSGKVSDPNSPSARNRINKELPSKLLTITQEKVTSLKSKILTIGDKAVQDEYLKTINWLDVNEYWYQRIPDDKSKMTQCIKLLQFILLDVLEIVESIIDGSIFIAYSLIRICNSFSRIMVVYYTQNDGMFLDLELSNKLKEKINSIIKTIGKLGENSLYYNGLSYESKISEACINICPVDNPEGKKLGLSLLKEIVKSAASMSPSADLFSNLGDFAVFGIKALYQKYKESNFKEMMTKCLFIEQVKWTVVNAIEREIFSIKQMFNMLARLYKNEVLTSTSWEVKYCWIKANHWIMGYRLIITQEMCNQQIDRFDSFWYELTSQQIIQIIDRSDQRIGAIVDENQLQIIDLSATNPIYQKLSAFTRLLNRIKSKLLNGSESLPSVLKYAEEFSNTNIIQQHALNQKIIDVQGQLEYFEIGQLLQQFQQIQSLVNDLLNNLADLNELIIDFNYQEIDQYSIEDIQQQSKLILKQLAELIQMIIKVCVSITQFTAVANNFNQTLIFDNALKKQFIELNSILKISLIIRQTYEVFTEYVNSQTNDQQHNLDYRLMLIKYIQKSIQDVNSQSEQIGDQGIRPKYTSIMTQLVSEIQNNNSLTPLIDQLQQLGQTVQENTFKNSKETDFIVLLSLLQNSKDSIENVDTYLQAIQTMNNLYAKLSFIPFQYINSEQSEKLQQNPISFKELINIKIQMNSSSRLFNQIKHQFQKILFNKSSLNELYTRLCQKQVLIIPTPSQNKQILEKDVSLKFKILDLFKNSLQGENKVLVKLTQPLQFMDGILNLQRYFIQQYQSMVYQSQKIAQNIESIDTTKKDDHQDNNLLNTLKSTLMQAQNKIQAIQDYRARFIQQNGAIEKFQVLFTNLLQQDQEYILLFQKYNDNLEIKSWNIRIMNEDLFKKIQLPKENLIIEKSSADQRANINSIEQFKKHIINLEQIIQQYLDNSPIVSLKDTLIDMLNNITQFIMDDSILKNLIAKINSFNNTNSKELNYLNVLSINILENFKLIKKEHQVNEEQKVNNLSQNEEQQIQEFTLIKSNFNEKFSQYNESHLQFSNSLKQVMTFKMSEHQIKYKEVTNLEFKTSEYLFDLININFDQIINLQIISLQNEIHQENPTSNQSPTITALLEELKIPVNLSQDQVRQCLQYDQTSSIALDVTKQADGHLWRFRECQLFSVLITQQRLIGQYEIQYGQQLTILKAIETDNRVQKLLKSSDFVLQQQNSLERHWKQQSNTIQSLITAQLKQLSQLQKQIQSQQPGNDRDQLLQDHQTLEQQVNDQIENVSNIGSSLGITIAFIQDLKKELYVIQDQLKELNSKMSDMSMDIKFLIGKTPQQLLEIRMEKVLKQKMIDDARSVYVQLYTFEMEDFDKKVESKKRTPLFNSNEEYDGEIEEFINKPKQSSLLVHGPAGSGKSTAAKKVEEHLWTKYKAQQIRNWDDCKEIPIIPIFIQLPTLKDPKFKALQETLKSTAYLFNDKQIGDLQKLVQNKKIKLFIIMDSYDELNRYYIEQPLNITNKFEQWCEGANYQILNTTRSEIFTAKTEYRDWFVSTSKKISKENFKEIRILPFEQDQRVSFYRQYCKLSLKQAIIDIYDMLFEQKNTKVDIALIINGLWEQINSVLNTNDSNEKDLLNDSQIDQIISLIKSQTINKIDLYKDQETHLRQQLTQLWSQKMYIENIELLKITHLVETPYMTNIVVSVLPQLIEQFSSQDHLKLVFIRNISGKQMSNKNFTLIKLKPNEIWDILIESKSLVEYKITNNKTSEIIISSILKEVKSILKEVDSQLTKDIESNQNQYDQYQNLIKFIQESIDFKEQAFDSRKLCKLLQTHQNQIQDKTLQSYFQILLDYAVIIQSIEQNKPTSYDFYQLFLSEFIKKQISKLSYKQRNFQIGKFFDDAQEYVQNLGTIMTTNQLTSIEYHQQGIKEKQSEGKLQDQFFSLFDDNAKHSSMKAQIRNSIPLKVRGDSFSFYHKSIQEFLFAKSFIDLLDFMMPLQDLKIQQLFEYRKSQNYNQQWNYTEISSYEDYRKQIAQSGEKLKSQQVIVLIKYLNYLDKHFINEKIYSEDFFIGSINFIVNKIKQNFELLSTILILLKISKLSSNFLNCTSNILHLIKRSQVAIAGEDLSGIYVSKISIINLNLRQANLSYTKFNKVNIDGINLANANLTGCKWQQLTTNELPMLKVKSGVLCVAYSKDSTRLVTGNKDGSIIIWDSQSGKQIGESLTGHTSYVYSVTYSPDGRFIASGSGDQTVRIWDSQSGKQIGESLTGHTDGVFSVTYSPDGRFIASGSGDKTVRIWDSQSGKQIGESLTGHTDFVNSVTYSPDGRFIASGSGDKTVRIWDSQSGKQIGESLTGHTDFVNSVTYSPDGRFIASGSGDKTVRIWDSQSGKQIGESLTGHTNRVYSVTYSPDGRFIASGSYDNTVRIWDSQSGKQIGESLTGHTDFVNSVTYSPDGRFIASGSGDKTVRIWDSQSGKQIGESLTGHTDFVNSVTYSPDGRFIASGSDDKTVRIWDSQSGKQIGESLTGHTNRVYSVTYSPDGRFIASGSYDNTVRIWDSQSGKQIGESLTGHTSNVYSVTYSPDGRFIASGSGDKTVRIWDSQSGKQIGESLTGHTDGVFSVTYSPDGRFIASGSGDKTVRIWDSQSGKQIGESLTGHTGDVNSVTYSPDGRFIASGSGDKTVRIWDSQSGKQIGESLTGHTSNVYSVTYSPDGRFIASGSGDKTVRIWDSQSGKQIGESLTGHTGDVNSVTYSPDGRFIASGSGDKTVRIWDSQSGKQIGEITKEMRKEVLETLGNQSKKWLEQVSHTQFNKQPINQEEQDLIMLFLNENKLKQRNRCVLRIPNTGPILYQNCIVFQSQIQSRLGINVLQLWIDRQNEID